MPKKIPTPKHQHFELMFVALVTVLAGTTAYALTNGGSTRGSAALIPYECSFTSCKITPPPAACESANPNATITAPASVAANKTGYTASVANAGIGAVYAWTLQGAVITAGQGTPNITFRALSGGSLVINVQITMPNCLPVAGIKTGTITMAYFCPQMTDGDVNISAEAKVGTALMMESPYNGQNATHQWLVIRGAFTVIGSSNQRSFSYIPDTAEPLKIQHRLSCTEGQIYTTEQSITVLPADDLSPGLSAD